MANITAIAGISGSGKTLLAANRAFRNYLHGYKIYSNFDLDFHGNIKVPFKKRYVAGKLDYIPIFEPKDLFKIRPRGKWSLHLDEIDAFGADENYRGGADSYDYQSDSARLVSQFFKKRLRRMDGMVDYTVQHMGQVPKRIREETVKVMKPHIYKYYRGTKTPAKMRIEYEFIDVGTGDFYKANDLVGFLKDPLGKGYDLILPEMLNCYDTKADPLSTKNIPQSLKDKTPVENAVYDDIVYKKVRDMFGSSVEVIKLKDSGRYSQWHGDILINGYKQQLILDVTGVKKRFASGDHQGEAMQIDLGHKWKGVKDMLALDQKIGSMHLFVYYDLDPEEDPADESKWIWKALPAGILSDDINSSDYALRFSKFVTREKILRVQACWDYIGPLKNIKKLIKPVISENLKKIAEGAETI